MIRPAIIVAAIMGISSAAHAQVVLASGKLYGGPRQTLAICYLSNVGQRTIELTDLAIRDEDGNVQSVHESTCHQTLAGGTGCNIQVYLSSSTPYDCSVNVTTARNMRGSLEIRHYAGPDSPTILQMQPLR